MDIVLPRFEDASPQAPLWIAHRGAAARAPENTMAAYRAALASGLRVLEQDVRVLADGALVVMHDATVDRTTEQRGEVAALDSAGFRALRVDVRRHPGFDAGMAPPFFADVLAEFRGRALFVPEAKAPGSGAALVAALRAHDIASGHALVQAFALDDLAPAVAAGYPAMYLTRHAGDIDAARAMGVTWAGLHRQADASVYAAWRDAGFRLVAYTVDDPRERDRLLARGVCGFFSDDPLALMQH